jgi:hypothetical protein
MEQANQIWVQAIKDIKTNTHLSETLSLNLD